jgi:hypothetical protein
VRKIMLASLSILLCIGLSACADNSGTVKTTKTTNDKKITTTTTLETTEAVKSGALDDPTTGTTMLNVADEDKIISEDAKKIIFGTWVVTRQVITDPENFDAKTIKNLLKNKRITYSEKSAKFDNIECANPIYKETEFTNYDFFQKSRLELWILGIKEKTVTAIDVFEPNDPPTVWQSVGNNVLIKDKNTLVLVIQGDYYILERVK